ncbi:MAG TPA: hypothetical protein VFV61_04640, partial [Pyrinomonadaceae bacterium]|nr:hypothetical protein [Pyrinomonadaceae bacterium]
LHSAAVDQLQKAVSIDESIAKNANAPSSPVYRFHLGMALKAKGDKDAARRELETALRLGEKVPFKESDEARKALSTM